ncbi:MAG: UDP-N-acetylmuramoyl-tripeptide--D-alanyl-D-alanine ligase [Muribaculaceae bacterium]|nr:UDP-N-acetylmuramoyl-tripeptide--D-alanyl-D-alanine ligase [Muribaculaceae bacterium]
MELGIFSIIIFIICGVYLLLDFKHDIHMLQQNSYRLERYWKWLKGGDISSVWRLTDVACIFLLFASGLLPVAGAALLICCVCIVKIYLILRKKFKKPLVFTNRVRRIYSVTAILALGGYIAMILSLGGKQNVDGIYSGSAICLGFLLLLSFFSWILVCLAVIILTPVEKAINRKYYNEAKSILRSMPNLKVVGVTGSYGKTSTKHYLQRILSEQFETLMTPGSYNTTMGVIRTVREMMKPYTEIFVCEMGAKQRGDVKEICDLVDPQMGIVTAVGPMHLQTFKSIENVQATKFELVDSLPSDGLAVVNDDFEYCSNRRVDNVECLRYAVDNKKHANYVAEDIKYTPEGSTFRMIGSDGFSMDLHTKLVGECNISNIMAAVIIALRLGVPEEKIKYAVGCIEQVEHRLSIRRHPGGVTVIDDAFNSNPSGSKMALDVLKTFKEQGKRIVVTPGMIELGAKQEELNEEFGRHIAKSVDIAIIVSSYNRDAIVRGINSAEFDSDNLYTVDSFKEAQQLLSTLMKSGDTVLYENDLPDAFE